MQRGVYNHFPRITTSQTPQASQARPAQPYSSIVSLQQSLPTHRSEFHSKLYDQDNSFNRHQGEFTVEQLNPRLSQRDVMTMNAFPKPLQQSHHRLPLSFSKHSTTNLATHTAPIEDLSSTESISTAVAVVKNEYQEHPLSEQTTTGVWANIPHVVKHIPTIQRDASAMLPTTAGYFGEQQPFSCILQCHHNPL